MGRAFERPRQRREGNGPFPPQDPGRMTLQELGEFAGGKHHNAVSIAISRFSARLQKDKVLRRKVSLVEMALSEPDRLSSASQCNV